MNKKKTGLEQTKSASNVFAPISLDDLNDILDLTIKYDRENKIITFLGAISAYTESSQLNLCFSAPSSTGKSYLPLEIASLFPPEDVIRLGYASPTSFFHDTGKYDKEKDVTEVDLSRKIIIFLDQPHTDLLQRLRPLLSHDQKRINYKITDKSQKHGFRAKNLTIIGFPVVIFCSANLKMDEQESTRCLLLSPEGTQEKYYAGIIEKLQKESNVKAHQAEIASNPKRKALMERIVAIRDAQINEINIHNEQAVQEKFFENKKKLKARDQRDIGRITSIIKAHALLNFRHRERKGDTIYTSDQDIEAAFALWRSVERSQVNNVAPYLLNFFDKILMPLWQEQSGKKVGISRRQLATKYMSVHETALSPWKLNQEIIPMLESAGLIVTDKDPNDKRGRLIFPLKGGDK